MSTALISCHQKELTSHPEHSVLPKEKSQVNAYTVLVKCMQWSHCYTLPMAGRKMKRVTLEDLQRAVKSSMKSISLARVIHFIRHAEVLDHIYFCHSHFLRLYIYYMEYI